MAEPAVDPRIAYIVDYMQQHLAEQMSVSELATRVNLSPSRFRALFVVYTDRSPGQYLQWLRLHRARVLLERTFLSVKEVRRQVGYRDASHFSRDFARHHGAPPTDFRGRDLSPGRPGDVGSLLNPRGTQ